MRTQRREQVKRLVETRRFQRLVMAVIFCNAVILGIQTAQLGAAAAKALFVLDGLCIVFYVTEAALKLAAYGRAYFRDGWNVFDFTIVALSLVPTSLLPIPVQLASTASTPPRRCMSI